MKIFAPLTKVDVEKREVWGRATHEVADKSGEIFDYASSKPLFQAWSAEFEKVTEGKSLGNIRAMHGKVAAGKIIHIDFNDAEKAIDIGTKIVDDAEWQKVVEGVYTGFSIGGSYTKRWKDGDLMRFTAQPAETSLVDNPCVPTAVFSMVKADGTTEEKHFRDPVEQVWRCGAVDCFHATKADAASHRAEAVEKAAAGTIEEPADAPAVKFADVEKSEFPIDTEEQIRAAWAAMTKDSLPAVRDRIVTEWKHVIDAAGPPVEKVEKGLWSVGDLANALATIGSIAGSAEWESQYEGDGSTLPAQLRAWLAEGAPLLVQMASEESQELVDSLAEMADAGDTAVVEILADAAKDELGKKLGKAGARNSKSDASKIQGIHDSSMALGASCPASDKAASDELAKRADEVTALQKSFDDLTVEKAVLIERVKTLEAMPAPAKAALRAVEKADDKDLALKATSELDEQIAKAATPEERAYLEIKKAQRSPMRLLAR